jgi:hypothetical protein
LQEGYTASGLKIPYAHASVKDFWRLPERIRVQIIVSDDNNCKLIIKKHDLICGDLPGKSVRSPKSISRPIRIDKSFHGPIDWMLRAIDRPGDIEGESEALKETSHVRLRGIGSLRRTLFDVISAPPGTWVALERPWILPGEHFRKDSAGRALCDAIWIHRLPKELVDNAEEGLHEIDVGHHEPVQVPVINKAWHETEARQLS